MGVGNYCFSSNIWLVYFCENISYFFPLKFMLVLHFFFWVEVSVFLYQRENKFDDGRIGQPFFKNARTKCLGIKQRHMIWYLG